MSTQTFDTRRFTLFAFLGFAAVFVFLMMMMQWSGPSKVKAEGGFEYKTAVVEPSGS